MRRASHIVTRDDVRPGTLLHFGRTDEFKMRLTNGDGQWASGYSVLPWDVTIPALIFKVVLVDTSVTADRIVDGTMPLDVHAWLAELVDV